MRRTAWVLAAAVLCAACGGGGSDSANDRQAPDRAPKRGGTLTVLWTNDVALIDCGATYYQMDWFLCWSTQRPLYNYKPDSVNMVPDVATGAPEVSADARTVTVKLRTGVKFSPPVNREVTSADVKYAIERGFFRTVNTGYAPVYFGDVEGAKPGVKPGTKIAGIEAPDAQTLVFHLTKPTGGVLAAGALALPLTAPVPEEYAAPFDAKEPSVYGQHQVATGPYMIANDAQGNATGYKPQRGVHLVRNPSWDASTDYKPAYVDEIENVMGNGDTGVASRKILEGRSMATGDFSPPPDVLKQAMEHNKSQLLLSPSTGGRWISMNTKLKPFDDLNVRKAVLAGFDRNALRLTRGGEPAGTIATHFLPPTIAGFSEAGGDKGPGYDFLDASGKPNKALSADYFKKAGYPSGKYTGGEKLLMVGANTGVAARAAEVTKQQFEDMGFKVTLRLVGIETAYVRYCNVPKMKVAVCPNVGLNADFADGQTLLDPSFNGDSIVPVNNTNWPQLDDPQINQAMTKAKELGKPQERAQAWARIDRMVTAQAPAIPWLWDNTPVLESKDVHGAVSKANGGILDLNFTWVG
jgi:peptide/nickel transport system substrate-binding protein